MLRAHVHVLVFRTFELGVHSGSNEPTWSLLSRLVTPIVQRFQETGTSSGGADGVAEVLATLVSAERVVCDDGPVAQERG